MFTDKLFTGTGFTLTYVKANNRGLIDVYVDGSRVATINAYDASTLWQQTWTSPAYPAGDHTVRFVHAGGNTYIDVDQIQIQGVFVTPTPAPEVPGWQETLYNYNGAQPHAVTSLSVDQTSAGTYEYDANGNMTCRAENGVTYRQNYNAENRISSIARINGLCSNPGAEIVEVWAFAYDGDGTRVSTAHFTGLNPTPDSFSAYFMGGAYEITDGAARKYYVFAGQTIAMRDGTGLKYFLTDHLGSVAAIMTPNQSGGWDTTQQRYLPFGEVRTDIGSISQTDFGYTSQRKLDEGMGGLMDYKARFYSPTLGRFIQPDSIVPNAANPQGFNRFSYVINNPLQYTDPTGHKWDDCKGLNDVQCKRRMQRVGKIKARWAAESAGSRAGKVAGPLTLRPRSTNLYCGFGCNPWAGSQGTLGGFGGGWASFTASDGSYRPFTYSRDTGDQADSNQSDSNQACTLSLSCVWSRITSGPDYVVLNVVVPIANPVVGVNVQVIRDYYGSWYWAIGPGASFIGPSGSLEAGWILRGDRDREYLEKFIRGWSIYGGANYYLAGGVNWGNIELPADSSDFALQIGVGGPPGGSVGGVYGMWIYKQGSPRPWFCQNWNFPIKC